MNRVYTRGLFKQILKDWEQVMFERQIETSKITRHLTTQNTDKNKYDVENEKWIPEELSSSVEKTKEKKMIYYIYYQTIVKMYIMKEKINFI